MSILDEEELYESWKEEEASDEGETFDGVDINGGYSPTHSVSSSFNQGIQPIEAKLMDISNSGRLTLDFSRAVEVQVGFLNVRADRGLDSDEEIERN